MWWLAKHCTSVCVENKIEYERKRKREVKKKNRNNLVGFLNEEVDRCHKKPVLFTQTKSKQTQEIDDEERKTKNKC